MLISAPFFQLRGVWRCRWEAEHLGLEDHQAVPPDQGSRQGVHQRTVASARNLEGHHLRLGRTDQALGLDVRMCACVSVLGGGIELNWFTIDRQDGTGCPMDFVKNKVKATGLVSSPIVAAYFCILP